MFTTARMKLTIWYLLIIMLISIMFSFTIYRILTDELERGFHRISEHYVQQFGTQINIINPLTLEPSYVSASEQHIAWTLVYINGIIFVVSGIGGYILAGITLRPIKDMIDEQNRFVADASHELRTPITALRSEIEVYLRGKSHSTRAADALLQSNLEEVNTLQTLSDNLIELAQYQKAPTADNATQVSITTIINQAEKKLHKQATQKNITIEQKPIAVFVYGNEDSLVQALGILLDNAVKYSPPHTNILIKARKTDGTVALSVTNQGIPIDARDIPHIFDRFYRADVSRTKQEITGYGLGLSIAKKIISEHQGTITVESEEKKGTTFTILLPIVKSPSSAHFQPSKV